ncbi:SHOCT domain-containing protein [Clostridioides difficile]|uniref:SHOCT domain-containing protein n=1 Tax=Clostridioides difficile TaxID=1496 RepID=UPI00038DB511|nr:SHOCT domain-containing protein [Clostridioides difficile]EQJ86250.1 short C-terminal domain protein [Clostridioides difficile P48]MBH8106238.1 SHOCT domain-containing protein [Clostridioides difficile]MBJ8627459.1 SHOCT domain-containing protein [Clostridioides difficile]MBJ9796743.1 SHOCT domain-containing protein [Clostridioides difficile]MCA0606648.1 SHOCT domain-containing protein [Clostridioides difficile]
MGLFSAKEPCVICGKETKHLKISDGYVCGDCVGKCGILLMLFPKKGKEMTKEDVISVIKRNEQREKELESFTATKKIAKYLQIDEPRKKFIIPSEYGKMSDVVLSLNDILEYELLEDGETIIKGGLGRALTGGILFGGVGAVVGGVTGKKETKAVVNNLRIKVTLNDINTPVLYIDLIKSSTKKNSIIYRSNYDIAQEILSVFSVIENNNKNENVQQNNINQTPNNSLEQIKTLKELLDMGAITEEEFNAKKKELLNL